MNQLAFLLQFPASRKTDPSTSHAAANRARGFAVSHRNRIMAALDTPGTAHEIAERCGLLAHQVLKRLPECQRLGLAEPTGVERNGAREWRRK